MRRWIWPLGAMLLSATMLTALACSSDEEKTTTPGAVSLVQDDFYFQPTKLTGEAGKPLQVELKNEGKKTHTFTIDVLNIDQTMKPGETKTITVIPKTGGDLPFYCTFHRDSNGMKGTITVPGGVSPSSPTKTSTSGGGYGY